MRRITAGVVLAAGVVFSAAPVALAQDLEAGSDQVVEADQSTVPDAIESSGGRPKADPSVITPAAQELSEELQDLVAPSSLALPNELEQIRVNELRPLTLEQTLQLAEFNSPRLKAVAKQVEQAQSSLRAALSSWYPTVDFSANGLPDYFKSYTYRNPDFVPPRVRQTGEVNPFTGLPVTRTVDGNPETYARQWRVNATLQVRWDLINPARVPQIAAARDNYERFTDSYLIALRDLRLQTESAYFALQEADEGVRIGQASVRASLVSLRDARARYNAGVNTKLEVLEAETQLARDRTILTRGLEDQAIARRNLARLLDLPQNVTPTAATPSSPLGLWEPSLQESIKAAYQYREELDQLILDVSISNSQANAALAAVQPVLSFVNTTSTFRNEGQSNRNSLGAIDMDDYNWGVQNATALTATWRLFDGGRARAEYRRLKQVAEERSYLFAETRDLIRFQVEESFARLRSAIQSIETTSSEVLSSRESLRLSQLRVQAGVSTQREVVDNQRDLTSAEIRYSQAIRSYNTSLSELRRRTGLDALVACPSSALPAQKPEDEGVTMPIEPTPLKTACSVASASSQTADDVQPVRPLW